MKRPIIAVTAPVLDNGDMTLFYDYIHAIEAAGGAPVIIPYTENIEALSATLSVCDGILFTGGVDIEPTCYGEERLPDCGLAQPKRDELELKIFDLIRDMSIPIMAICRGAQLVNVALGGSLYQDIYTQYETDLAHRTTEPRYGYAHEVCVTEGTPLHALLGEDTVRVNTFHHQAIKTLGEGLGVMAKAPDGIIEAVYSEGERYIRAYQWHPERLHYTDEFNQMLFTDFISECQK